MLLKKDYVRFSSVVGLNIFTHNVDMDIFFNVVGMPETHIMLYILDRYQQVIEIDI